MRTVARPASTESQARRRHLLRLRDALCQHGVPVRVVKLRHERWLLKVNSESVLCAGAEGVYVYVTRQGRILSPASDEGVVAAALQLAESARR